MKNALYEKIILTVLSLYALSILIVRVAIIFSFLPETGGVSINMMYGIMHLSKTSILYSNPEFAPFSIIQYMPLYYYLISGIGKLFNISNDVHQMLVVNRMICFLSGVAYSFLLFYCIRKFFPKVGFRIASAIGLLMFILIPSHNYGRLDNLYLVFCMAAIYTFINYLQIKYRDEKINLQALLLSGLFCSLAVLTKQTGIIITVFFCGWLLVIEKSPLRLLQFLLAFILPTAIGIYLTLPSTPLDFKLNTINGIKNGIDLNWFYQVTVKYYFAESGFLIAFGLYIAGWLLFERKPGLKLFISGSILFLFATAFLMSMKGGGNPYYFLEFTFMVFIGICFLINTQPDNYKKYMPYITLLLPFFLMSTINDKGWHELGRMKKAKKDYNDCLQVSNYINQNIRKGNYIYSNFHLENTLNLMQSETALFPCREVAFRFTYPQGVFKFSQFDTLMKNNQVQYIIANADDFPVKILDTPIVNYKKDTVIADYTIYQRITN